ncbi:MAG TPA: glycosyltransferase family 2 protein [Thermoanaerobaculia bacterium]|nr:glycosyltransferase family 2 protein [Thermoanaerobaculia bacterium]
MSVLVLSWNGLRHLETLRPAIEALEPPGVDWELLVLDNGSSDGTADWVRSRWPRARLIESPSNLGFAAGNRRLVEEASGDAIAFLNNDTRVVPGWLAALVAALASAPNDVAAVSGLTLDWQGERLDFGRGIMTFDGHGFQLDYGRPLAQARRPAAGAELLFPSGGNMLIRRDAFLAAGGFDEDYFAYLEDVDLGWRLWSAGWRVLHAPAACSYHRGSGTSDLLGQSHRGFLFERNAFLTAYKNYEAGLWESMMPAVLLTLLSRLETLIVENNPGGELLTVDPYAGLIANTVSCSPSPLHPGAGARPVGGARALWRRAVGAVRGADPGRGRSRAAGGPVLDDPRTIAHHRAAWNLLGGLDRAAVKRERVQQMRRRGDAEIFARFPLYLVPTYPGDGTLFGSAGFRSWLPPEVALLESTLEEVMAWQR